MPGTACNSGAQNDLLPPGVHGFVDMDVEAAAYRERAIAEEQERFQARREGHRGTRRKIDTICMGWGGVISVQQVIAATRYPHLRARYIWTSPTATGQLTLLRRVTCDSRPPTDQRQRRTDLGLSVRRLVCAVRYCQQ